MNRALSSRRRGVLWLAAAALGMGVGFLWRGSPVGSTGDSVVVGTAASGVRVPVPREASTPAGRFRSASAETLAVRLERELARRSGVDRWLAWLEAMERATAADFPALALLARDNPAALQCVAVRWAAVDPRHFFDTLLGERRHPRGLPVSALARVLFEEWPRSDAESAIAALGGTREATAQPWRIDVATAVIQNDIERGLRLFAEWRIGNHIPFADERGPVPKWAATDPRHAAEYALKHAAGDVTQGALKVIGEVWGRENPAAALQFASHTPGQSGTLLGAAALQSWAERDLRAATEWLASADAAARQRLSPGFVAAWARKDAQSALVWCQENLVGSGRSQAVKAIVEGAGPERVAATADLVSKMEPSPERAEAALAVARQWFPSLGGRSGPAGNQAVGPEVQAWLAGLDEVSRKRVLEQETWSWATSDPRSMGEFLLAQAGEPLGDWPETCLARQWARQDPVEALEWARRLPGARALTTGGEAYAEWRSTQPEAASRWLDGLPAGDPRREPFLRQAVRDLAYGPQAQDQLAGLNGPERAVARSVIEAMSELSAADRARLLEGLGIP